ncbi:hypothetical protein A3A38_04080 [Candidatus Kaiserbacteria bacterium RIFCSPLOWO2_01_FULL_53_17]|uniref:Uncharacterized protein n=1 Tax=Candidatus Kaiserbacteria bacterium RIFCSPLOWO2_01_FULL_53_17 TaxID=1798511 RepID=A0A1F6EFU1_9BACT|nr:MAG: hypothetical protein A3A38_04080 [Candidatus Kaiserbacteria bacterium RIFCSPLOWO2_01_FULL_53_17]
MGMQRLSFGANVVLLILAAFLTGVAVVVVSIFAGDEYKSRVLQIETSGVSLDRSSACASPPDGYICVSNLMGSTESYYVLNASVRDDFLEGWESRIWVIENTESVLSYINYGIPPGWTRNQPLEEYYVNGHREWVRLNAQGDAGPRAVAWMNLHVLSPEDVSDAAYRAMIAAEYSHYTLEFLRERPGNYRRIARWHGTYTSWDLTQSYQLELVHFRDMTDGTVYAVDVMWDDSLTELLTPVIVAMIQSLYLSFDEGFGTGAGNAYGP